MKNRILVILGHPNKVSFCNTLAEAYVSGAREAGAQVRFVQLGELDFDPILHEGYAAIQELEDDLVSVQKDILWAEHIVIVYPTWWGGVPALLKGFIERTILPGFGFKYKHKSALWQKKLRGRTAHLITTMDSPRWYQALTIGSPGYTMLKHATLRFCGVWPVRYTVLDRLRFRTDAWRMMKVEKVRTLGRKLL